jgi:hypothetical protein
MADEPELINPPPLICLPPPLVSRPARPPTPLQPNAPNQQQRRKLDLGSFTESDYLVLHSELRKRLEIFNAKLYMHNSYWRLTSPGRSAEKQHKLHLSRIVSWGFAGIRASTPNGRKSKEQAQKIYLTATALLKDLLGPQATDEQTTRYATNQKNAIFKNQPVAAGYRPCPCGCGMGRSKHVFDKAGDARSADGNIFPIDPRKPGLTVNSGTPGRDSEQFKTVERLSKESNNLVWGGTWPNMDRVHWELPK